jgi:cytochrome c553
MRKLGILFALMLFPTLATAADKPDWAFPVTEKVQPPAKDDGKPKTAPDSPLSLTRAQIDDMFNPPDWRPDVVAHGRQPNVRACGSCHLPTGNGHDESAYVAGLTPGYFTRQILDFKSGARKGSGSMTAIGKDITDDEIKAAADYFAAVKPRQWVRVAEVDAVPKTFVGPGNKRLVHPDGGSEPIGQRIIVVPEDEDIVLNRDPKKGFVAYVPKGSIARGEALAKTGGDGRTVACGVCHGPTLHGIADIPPLAGRTPNHMVRQMFMMQNGDRAGPQSGLMAQVVKNLSVDDMLNLAAYAASMEPR